MSASPVELTSTRPYLMRAIYEWCVDNGLTPHVAVTVDEHTRVPMEHVRNGEIVLNIGVTATNRLNIGNDMLTFQARFSGAVRELSIPIENVSAIYARENGHGMAFEVSKSTAALPDPRPTPTPGAISTVPQGAGGPVAGSGDRVDEVGNAGAGAGAGGAGSAGNAPGNADDAPWPQSPEPGPDGRPPQRGRAKLTRIK